MKDDLIIFYIRVLYLLADRLNEMELITDYQFGSIRKWLITSTKKAERKYR